METKCCALVQKVICVEIIQICFCNKSKFIILYPVIGLVSSSNLNLREVSPSLGVFGVLLFKIGILRTMNFYNHIYHYVF